MTKEIDYFHPIFESTIEDLKIFMVGLLMLVSPNCQEIIKAQYRNIGENKNPEVKSSIRFDDNEMSFSFEEVFEMVKGKMKSTNQNEAERESVMYFLNNHAKQVIIFAFAQLEDFLADKNYKSQFEETQIFLFAKHIRNGAAHNNHFDIRNPKKVPVNWNKKTIIFNLNGTNVFPSFIGFFEVPFLIADLSLELKKFDEKSNLTELGKTALREAATGKTKNHAEVKALFEVENSAV